MKIGQVAEQLRVRPSTLRFYEKAGILGTRAGTRGTNNYREYSTEDVERLRLVLSLKSAGFRLEDVATLLRPDSSDCETLLVTAERQLKLVCQAIDELQKRKESLETLVLSCRTSCDPGNRLTSTDGLVTSECVSEAYQIR